MKRITLIVFILSFTLILTACGKSIEEKIGEKITEKIVEDAIGGDIDIKDDKTTIKTDQGSSQFGSELDWPKDKMGKIPEIKANIVAVFEDNSNKSIGITFEELSMDDAKDYVNKLKELGYSKGSESLSSDSVTFSGYLEDKTEVLLMYSAGSGTLIYMPESSAAESAFKSDENTVDSGVGQVFEEIDMTDDVPWPKNFMGDIPELEGKIVGMNQSDGYVSINFQYVEKEAFSDYIKKVKEIGFSIDSYDSMGGDYISYQAYNDKDEYITANWSSGGYAYIELSKP